MSRINSILEHLIQSSKIQGDKDLELCISILRGAIDKGIVDELSDAMVEFGKRKAIERQIKEN